MPLLLRFCIVAVIVVLDQITKISIDRTLELYDRIPITSFFNITYARNYGAAFSFLDHEGGWQRWFFTVVSAVVSVVLIVWLRRLSPRERWMSVALALILGGAIGNLIDRAVYGYVIDFIQVYWQDVFVFPSFNIADAAISCGAALFLGLTIFERPTARASN